MEDQQFNTMETPQPNYVGNGIIGTTVSLGSTVLAWINLQNTQIIMAIAASGVAVISGCLAGYNWWLNIKEKRLNIEKLKSQK